MVSRLALGYGKGIRTECKGSRLEHGYKSFRFFILAKLYRLEFIFQGYTFIEFAGAHFGLDMIGKLFRMSNPAVFFGMAFLSALRMRTDKVGFLFLHPLICRGLMLGLAQTHSHLFRKQTRSKEMNIGRDLRSLSLPIKLPDANEITVGLRKPIQDTRDQLKVVINLAHVSNIHSETTVLMNVFDHRVTSGQLQV